MKGNLIPLPLCTFSCSDSYVYLLFKNVLCVSVSVSIGWKEANTLVTEQETWEMKGWWIVEKSKF